MARPPKLTVDYFSHDANASTGTTLTILQYEYGNDGYAFWYRLLELLARTPGHVFDTNNPARWGFLCAITHLNEITCEKILSKLAELEAIDPQLWQRKIIWSQNFVNRLADVYTRRNQPIPPKPVIDTDNPTSAPVSDTNNSPPLGFLLPETPQTKLKETRLKETTTRNPSPPQLSPPETTPQPQFRVAETLQPGDSASGEVALVTRDTETTPLAPKDDPDLLALISAYENEIGYITPSIGDTLAQALREYPKDWILESISIAVESNKRSWRYCQAILKRWKAEGKDDGTKRGQAEQSELSKALTQSKKYRAEQAEAAERRAKARGTKGQG